MVCDNREDKTMRRSLMLAAMLLWGAIAASPAGAHSLHDLERLMGNKEKYFQLIDKPAPSFSLADADAHPVRLEDLHGKVIVLHFIYASCPDICPLHAERIAEIQAMVNRTPMKEQVRFVSITTDPSKDGGEVLRSYGQAHGLDPGNWMFLTTWPSQPEDTTRKLAEAFGHKFMKIEEGHQIHSIVTHVIDRDGRWRANFHGLKFDPVNLVVFVNGLVNDVQRPHDHPPKGLWDRVRELF
jgi:protein SCO1